MAKKKSTVTRQVVTTKAIAESQRAADEAKAVKDAEQQQAVADQIGRIQNREKKTYGVLGRPKTIGGVVHRLQNIQHLHYSGPAWVPESDISFGGPKEIVAKPENAIDPLSGKRLFGKAAPVGRVTAGGIVKPASYDSRRKPYNLGGGKPVDNASLVNLGDPLAQKQAADRAEREAKEKAAFEEKYGKDYDPTKEPGYGKTRTGGFRGKPAPYEPVPSARVKSYPKGTSQAKILISNWLNDKRKGLVGPKEGTTLHLRDVKTTRDEVIHPGDPANGIDPIVVPKGTTIVKKGEPKPPIVVKNGSVKNIAPAEVGFNRSSLIDAAIAAHEQNLQGPRLNSGQFYSKPGNIVEKARGIAADKEGNFLPATAHSIREVNAMIHPLAVPTQGPKDPHTGEPILAGALEMPAGNPRFERAAISKTPKVTTAADISPAVARALGMQHLGEEAESTPAPERTINPYVDRMVQGARNYESLSPEEKIKGENLNAVVARESRPRGMKPKK